MPSACLLLAAACPGAGVCDGPHPVGFEVCCPGCPPCLEQPREALTCVAARPVVAEEAEVVHAVRVPRHDLAALAARGCGGLCAGGKSRRGAHHASTPAGSGSEPMGTPRRSSCNWSDQRTSSSGASALLTSASPVLFH